MNLVRVAAVQQLCHAFKLMDFDRLDSENLPHKLLVVVSKCCT
jgi:hypothetical protein